MRAPMRACRSRTGWPRRRLLMQRSLRMAA
jgi:hypothetical protein